MIYSAIGEPLQGLTGGDGGDKRWEYIIPTSDKKMGRFVVFIEVAANQMFGNGVGDLIAPPKPDRSFELKQARVVAFDRLIWDFVLKFRILHDLAKKLSVDSIRQQEAFRLMDRVCNIFKDDERESWKLALKLMDVFFSRNPKGDNGVIHAIGHCHIDTAWLWRYGETRRKCVRSWSTVMTHSQDYSFYV
jgi:alpha-mannosidase